MCKSSFPFLFIIICYFSNSYAEDFAANKAARAIDFLKTACAAGESIEVEASARGGLSFIKKGVSGAFSFKSEEARGIVDGLRDQLQHENLKSIRSCMEPHIDKILNVLIGFPANASIDVDRSGIDSGSLEITSSARSKSGVILPCAASGGEPSVGRTKEFTVDILKCSLQSSLLQCTLRIAKKPNAAKKLRIDGRYSSVLDEQGNEAYAESVQIGRSSGAYADRTFSAGDRALALINFDLSGSQPFPFSQHRSIQNMRIYMDGKHVDFKSVNICSAN